MFQAKINLSINVTGKAFPYHFAPKNLLRSSWFSSLLEDILRITDTAGLLQLSVHTCSKQVHVLTLISGDFSPRKTLWWL